MIQLPFPSKLKAQPRNVTFWAIKTMVRKIQKTDGQTGSCAWRSLCLDNGGGGVPILLHNRPTLLAHGEVQEHILK